MFPIPAPNHSRHPPRLTAATRVVAVELHPGRAALLRHRFPNITVVEADIRSLPLPRRPFRVVANPPYAITADLLRLLLNAGPRLTAADLILQRAVVRKYATHPSPQAPRTHWMSVGLTVPRHAFRPPPRVDSAVLLVRRRC